MSPAIVRLEDLRKTYQMGQVIVEALGGIQVASFVILWPFAPSATLHCYAHRLLHAIAR
jgi:hypothetical protein